MVPWVKLAKWLRRGPTGAGGGFESWKKSKKVLKKNWKIHFSLQSATATIYTRRIISPLSKNAGWLRCVNTTTGSWFESYDDKEQRHERHKEGEVHENREREGGSENRRDLVCLKELWTENRSTEGGHTQSTEVVGELVSLGKKNQKIYIEILFNIK